MEKITRGFFGSSGCDREAIGPGRNEKGISKVEDIDLLLAGQGKRFASLLEDISTADNENQQENGPPEKEIQGDVCQFGHFVFPFNFIEHFQGFRSI